jgi:hypothetical protein
MTNAVHTDLHGEPAGSITFASTTQPIQTDQSHPTYRINRHLSHTEKSLFPVPISQAWLRTSTGSGTSRLAAPTRRQKDVDHTVDPLIVTAFAASSITTFPFHTKYSSQAWEMGTGNNPVSVCERCLMHRVNMIRCRFST